MPTTLKVLVQCRFRLDLGSSRERGRLLALYGSDFSAIMRESLSKKHKSSDYRKLPDIRRSLKEIDTDEFVGFMVEGDMKPEQIKKITDIFPFFIRLPVDLQAFILMSCGLTPYL